MTNRELPVPAKLYEFEILIIQLQLRSQKLRRADERSVIRHSRIKGPEYAEARNPGRACADRQPKPAGRNSKRWLPLLALRFRGFDPPGQIVGKAREQTLQRLAALADRLAVRSTSVCAIGPTAIVLDTTTMPISDSVPCHAVAARAPESRPAE